MRCKYIHDDGRRCGAHTLADSDFCYFHDPRPEIAKKRVDAQRRGGRGRRRKRALVYEIKFNLKDPRQIPFAIDEALDLALHKMLDDQELEQVRKMAESAMRAHKLVSVDVKVDEILRRLKGERDRPVDRAEVDELLNFAPDDADEVAPAVADLRDEAGQHNGHDRARPQNGAAVDGQDHAEPGVNQDAAGADPDGGNV
jgi:hypothetical protein